MTKRMIDADALLEKIHNTMQDIFSDSLVALPHKGILRDVSVEEILYCMQDYIEQIATPAPEPQESIFDADGWCWDMEKAPYNTRIWVLMENCNLKKYITKVFKKTLKDEGWLKESSKVDWFLKDSNKDMDKFFYGYNYWGCKPAAWCEFKEPLIPEFKGGRDE